MPTMFIQRLVIAGLLTCAVVTSAAAQTPASTRNAAADEAAPKRKKIVERAADMVKKLADFSAKRGQKMPALKDYYATKADLHQIDDTAPEAPRAKKLLAAMQKNERDYLRKSGNPDVRSKLDALAGNIDGRKQFALDSRKQMLRRGLVMDIATTGGDDTVLNYKYFKMDRPTVLNLAETGKIFNKARDLGFRSVVFTDGHLTWTYDVAANTFK